jgi:hypothetical protein
MKKKVYIYIHIPKTAGMFIKNLISKHEENSKIFDPFTNVNDFSIPVKNAPTIKFVKQQLPAANSDDVGFFVIVRNPYDRIYSMWQGDYNNFYFMQSQLNFIQGEDINNLKLFKYEDMDSIRSFLQNCNVGWSEDKINNIPGPSYKDVYTPEMVEIIKTKYKDEFDILGYSTDL